MRIGITMDDERGLKGDVSQHFGQCRYFLLVEITDGAVTGSQVVPNTVSHGGGGCAAVDALLQHNLQQVISGGMGRGAQERLKQEGVGVSGFSGSVRDALNGFIGNSLPELESCAGHDHEQDGGCH